MADVLCPICGRPNGDHREFCDFCGNPLDGALRVDDSQTPAGEDFLDSQSLDEESRLDSFFSSSEDEPQPSQPSELPIDNGESRLDSFLAAEEDDLPTTAPADPGPRSESRLDDYLPVEDTPQTLEPDSTGEEESTRLGAYLTPEQAAEALPQEGDSLPEGDENGSSRLDDYLQPESPPEQAAPAEEAPAEASRLDEFLADDPFKSPDPFQDPAPTETDQEDPFSLEQDPFREPPSEDTLTSPADPSPWEEFSFSNDDTLPASPQPSPTEELETQSAAPGEDPSPAEEESTQWDFLEPTPSPTEEPAADQSLDPDAWGFLDPTPTPEEPEAEQPSGALDPEVWNFLDPEPDPDQPLKEQGQDSPDSGEWDFLDPTPTQEEPAETISPESIDPGTWDYLDPGAGQADEAGEAPSEAVNGGEWDRLESKPDPDRAPQDPSGSEESQEWDFLDPSPPAGSEEETSPSTESETEDDWSFLDPGPTQDLLDGPEPQSSPEEAGEDAGWLDMLQDPSTRPEFDPDQLLPAEPQKPQTDWLEKIKRLNKSSDLVDEDSSFPDWLAVTGKTAEFKGEGSQGDEESGDVPDWLKLDDDESLNEFLRKKDLGNDEYKPKFTTDSLDSDVVPETEEAPASDISDSQHIKFPSWAGDEKGKGPKPQAPQEPEKTPTAPEESAQPFQIEEEYFDDLFSEELPSWLTASSSESEEISYGQNLAQGELPGWVEAMRPVVESTDPSGLDEEEEYIENYGPLAGIPSVLPAEAEIGIDLDQTAQKPLDLLSTPKHKEYVELLQKLIGDEEKSVTIKVPPRLQSQRVLRWLIAIVMLVSIAATVIFSGTPETDQLTASQLTGTGFSALYDEVETLYDGQPVLIAYDYQPAAAGEMQIAAASVVDHLMEQGTFLTFISTQPTGPALAEHFLKVTQSHHEYKHTQKYINLGYLPGESAGLLSFTIAPQKIIPLAFDGSNAWDSPPLISVDRIQDFKMILVITDDPNTAKIWIEQVGSRLDRTPLMMVVSAQVEPLIQPYFRTSPRQVAGYVAGIIDSMNYEQLTERSYLASRAWLPFNMGIVISVGIIFISGLANGVLSLLKQRKDFLTGDSN